MNAVRTLALFVVGVVALTVALTLGAVWEWLNTGGDTSGEPEGEWLSRQW